MTSKVKWFDDIRGFGFIEYKDSEDIFVHYSEIIGKGHKKLVEGQEVKFNLINTAKGYQAKDVQVINSCVGAR